MTKRKRSQKVYPNRINELFKARGWTLERLSEETGISTSHLSNLQNGKRKLDTESLACLARAFGNGIQPADILKKPSAEPSVDEALSKLRESFPGSEDEEERLRADFIAVIEARIARGKH